jgi:adapter protein MecA 1/2
MEIERVNEYTIKFYITYRDIEKRGYNKDELWYNRERGEELFWEIMDEAHQQEEFPLEGPLWIQVQALDKGLEILVTRAALSNDGTKLELPISDDKTIDMPVDQNIEKLLDQNFKQTNEIDYDEELELYDDEQTSFVIGFEDFEDLISLSHSVDAEYFINSVYSYENRYYLYIVFDTELTDAEQDNILSQLLEYGFESNLTIHRIQEYGKEIVQDDGLLTIKNNFPPQDM